MCKQTRNTCYCFASGRRVHTLTCRECPCISVTRRKPDILLLSMLILFLKLFLEYLNMHLIVFSPLHLSSGLALSHFLHPADPSQASVIHRPGIGSGAASMPIVTPTTGGACWVMAGIVTQTGHVLQFPSIGCRAASMPTRGNDHGWCLLGASKIHLPRPGSVT